MAKKAQKAPAMPMAVSIMCSGCRIVIGVYNHPPGENTHRFTYAVMGDSNPIEPLGSDEEPQVDGGRVCTWFTETMGELFSDATGGDIDRGWVSFCSKYFERTERITTWVQLLERTKKVVSYPHEILEVTIDDQTCILEGRQVLEPKSFRTWFLYRFNSFLVMSDESWAEVVNVWMEDVEIGEEEKSLSPGMGAAEAVVNYICKMADVISMTKEEMERNPKRPWFDEGEIKLSGLVAVDKANDFKIKPRRLSSILRRDGYLIGPAKQERVGKSQINFWRFDPKKLGIDSQETLDAKTKQEEEARKRKKEDGE